MIIFKIIIIIIQLHMIVNACLIKKILKLTQPYYKINKGYDYDYDYGYYNTKRNLIFIFLGIYCLFFIKKIKRNRTRDYIQKKYKDINYYDKEEQEKIKLIYRKLKIENIKRNIKYK